MTRTDTTEGQPGRAEEDGRFREGDRHLRLAYGEEKKKRKKQNKTKQKADKAPADERHE